CAAQPPTPPLPTRRSSDLNDNLKQLAEGSLFYTENGNMWVMMLFLGLIILVKVLATSATNGGGGVGGTFAPSLYVGCFAGFFFRSEEHTSELQSRFDIVCR